MTRAQGKKKGGGVVKGVSSLKPLDLCAYVPKSALNIIENFLIETSP